MQNDLKPKMSDAEFKKAWEDLEDEYENELQRLHAEIEQEEKQNAEGTEKNGKE